MTPADLDAAAAAVLSWLLTYAIHSTLLLTLAAIAAWRLADRHAWLDLIWKTALIAPLVTSSLQLSPMALPLDERWPLPSHSEVTNRPSAAPVSATVAAPQVMPATTAERVTTAPVVDRAPASETYMPASVARLNVSPAIWRPWPTMVVAAWLIIAVAGVMRYGVRLRRVYRTLASGVPVTSSRLLDIVEGLRRTANQRRQIRLTTNPKCPVPLVLAGRHIVLPDRFLRELEPEEQRAALAHEVAHVARRDPAWRIGVDVLERVLFFQPLVRLARRRLCEAAEFLCDEWAVQQAQSPLAMARCLSAVASWWSPAIRLPAGVSAMARSDSAMVRRVTRILDAPARPSRPCLHWLAIPVALVAVAAPRV